ncbi:HvfA family oxazolone/thioamide-modified RiPP metallophore [Porticoccus sp. GXU_MW_L64]
MAKQTIKPLAAAVGAAFLASVAIAPAAMADNPFEASELTSGYNNTLTGDKGEEGKCGEGKCGEGKCGEDKGEEGKCGEGKCGEGKCGEDKGEEGKCGEGKCGAS